MSCYFRHMKNELEEAGVQITRENKKDIDRILHEMADVAYKNCSPTWKAIKAHIKADEKARQAFIQELKKKFNTG